MSYEEFIAKKRKRIKPMGFDVDEGSLNPHLFDWQRKIVHWALRRGRAAIFADTGLGKSLCLLSWSEQVHKHTNLPTIAHCPLGVRQQTLGEAKKFGIDCPIAVVNDQTEVINGINLVNYDKLHNFDPTTFAGVVLDESSILKNMNGKTKKMLCESYSQTPYRLACTATPAPNDHDELGSHAEFLGVCEAVDMKNRYFYHDSGDTAKWILMPHARKEFWAWVAQWAVCIEKPSDLKGSNEGYDLPPLNIERHIVENDSDEVQEGYLFNMVGISATSIHQEKRLTNVARCKKVQEIIYGIN